MKHIYTGNSICYYVTAISMHLNWLQCLLLSQNSQQFTVNKAYGARERHEYILNISQVID